MERDLKPTLSPTRNSRLFFSSEEGNKVSYKIYIMEYYISSLNLMLNRNGTVRDIFTELKKYDPAFNPSNFVAKEPVFGISSIVDDLRIVNLDMPLSFLKSNSVHLLKKVFMDQ